MLSYGLIIFINIEIFVDMFVYWAFIYRSIVGVGRGDLVIYFLSIVLFGFYVFGFCVCRFFKGCNDLNNISNEVLS